MKRASQAAALTRDIAVFAMLGACLEAAKWALNAVPNVELVTPLIAAYTLVYRARALIPVYIFVFYEGLTWAGFFTPWFVMYLYVWFVLWAAILLISHHSRERTNIFLLMLVCGLFGLAFGTLCAPVQAIAYGLPFRRIWAWIVAGLSFDAVHAVSNVATAVLILPVARTLAFLEQKNPFRKSRV